jgi:hypothetical protein
VDESKFIITFNGPGMAEFGTESRNVTPAQLLALAYALEHHTVKINPASENENFVESVLEVTFESPGSARCMIVKRGIVELLQIGGLILWLEWHARKFFDAGAARAAQEAMQKRKPENQILVPSMVVKQ